MRIKAKFFSNKVSRQIAILLFIAAVIPATLMTILSLSKINGLVINYEHQALVEQSRTHALNVFTNLIYARNQIRQELELEDNLSKLTNNQLLIADKEYYLFNYIEIVSKNGIIGDGKLTRAIPSETLSRLNENEHDKFNIIILNDEKGTPSINFLFSAKNTDNFYLANLNTVFLWGDAYDENLNVCAYAIVNNTQTTLFCSSDDFSTHQDASSPINAGSWDLFLNGEFESAPWTFETKRLTPLSQSHLREYIGSKAYIGISLLGLLIIGLLSLIQIRRTMVPMEKLVEGTEKIAEGVFSPIKVSGNSEFSALANAFNNMSAHIKKQLETLASYSAIDQEIISTIDVNRVIERILQRMHEVNPNLIFLIANLEESSNNEVQSNCRVVGHAALSSVRLVMTKNELNEISRASKGQFKTSSLSSQLIHERIMAELGTNHIWVLPIFWQDEVCSFLLAGSKTELDKKAETWSEFHDLSSRIGIVISAHRREQKLMTEAQYDSLTGLPNRILLQDRLKLAMDHSDRTGKSSWVIFIDLDRFKDVNDSYGHTMGDSLLIEIGTRLKAVIRETDTVARFGGDEFVIVLSGDEGEDIQLNVLNRVMDEITKPVHLHNRELVNTCSIGIAVYPNDGNNAETLIKNADIAMYRAKELGRNNYQFFKQSLNDKAAQRMQMISLMRKGIENNEFTLNYQPKVDLKTGNVVGLEALIRWENEQLGKVSPAQFIPVAEEAGLIVSIGEWVLRTACTQMAECQKNDYGELLMSVNVSAKQLTDVNFVERIKRALIETGLKAEYLELELTESMFMSDDKAIINKLHALKSLGIQLSIDDFGTGYSNLSYLHTMPIDTLKIDKSFIDTISLNKSKAPIVDTIINLAKNLDLKVVAEGVETEEQTNYLKTRGCDQIQGYYFSKPLPCDETKALLSSGRKLSLPKLTLVENKRIEI
ncbi:MAG: EAL domain-containing protein [Methylophilaceae bacterium]